MNPAFVKVDDFGYSFKSDAPRPDAGRWYGIVEFIVLDEMTNTPVRGPITLRSDRAGLVQRSVSSDDGMAGLVGIIQSAFRGIDLSLIAESITVGCSCPGYLPASFSVTIGPIPGYPGHIGNALPIKAGALLLHHKPLLIGGRITSAGGPIAGASVRLDEFMLNVVTPNTVFTPDARIAVAFPSPCYASRAIDDECRVVTIANGVAADKHLVMSAEHDLRHIQLDDAEGLAVGDLIEIDEGALSELIEITAIDEVADAAHVNQSNAWMDITLAHALMLRHAPGAIVRQRTAAAPGPIKRVRLDAIRGDACLLVDDIGGWNVNDVIRIRSAAGADEYHRIDFYNTVSDNDGYYRLPPINRVGQLSISATQGTLSGAARRIIPDYTRHNYLVDIGVAGP